ncbi:hypothetical protein V1498_17310 [Peribacillus sp. SCS-26]|uniref:ATP-dependent DNA ligase n=1 Tax=Paraperibacillus marinus TaxID=3115295 RepID=UPI003905E163
MQMAFSNDVVLDGENGGQEGWNPCWKSVMKRFHASKSINGLAFELPAHYAAFDTLYIEGKDITKRPIEERLEMLEEAVQDFPYNL